MDWRGLYQCRINDYSDVNGFLSKDLGKRETTCIHVHYGHIINLHTLGNNKAIINHRKYY